MAHQEAIERMAGGNLGRLKKALQEIHELFSTDALSAILLLTPWQMADLANQGDGEVEASSDLLAYNPEDFDRMLITVVKHIPADRRDVLIAELQREAGWVYPAD